MTGQSGRLTGLPVVVPDNRDRGTTTPSDLPADREAGVVAVFEAHYAHLVRLARHLVDDPADAEDVVMDAFVGLSRHWQHVRRTEDASSTFGPASSTAAGPGCGGSKLPVSAATRSSSATPPRPTRRRWRTWSTRRWSGL